MRDDAVLRRALPLGRGLGRAVLGVEIGMVREKSVLFEHSCNGTIVYTNLHNSERELWIDSKRTCTV